MLNFYRDFMAEAPDEFQADARLERGREPGLNQKQVRSEQCLSAEPKYNAELRVAVHGCYSILVLACVSSRRAVA